AGLRLSVRAANPGVPIHHGKTGHGARGQVRMGASRGTARATSRGQAGTFQIASIYELGSRQELFEKGEHFFPPILRLLGPVIRTIPGKKRVSRSVVAVKLVVLAEAFERGFGAVYAVGGRVGIFVTEQPQKRAAYSFRQLDGRNRLRVR